MKTSEVGCCRIDVTVGSGKTVGTGLEAQPVMTNTQTKGAQPVMTNTQTKGMTAIDFLSNILHLPILN
ncbi:MAG TPA: hypothetical protein PKE62_17580 [Anaerolineales bacterium]|nr:hypothetical protein [Anaerolineales bacterium]